MNNTPIDMTARPESQRRTRPTRSDNRHPFCRTWTGTTDTDRDVSPSVSMSPDAPDFNGRDQLYFQAGEPFFHLGIPMSICSLTLNREIYIVSSVRPALVKALSLPSICLHLTHEPYPQPLFLNLQYKYTHTHRDIHTYTPEKATFLRLTPCPHPRSAMRRTGPYAASVAALP